MSSPTIEGQVRAAGHEVARWIPVLARLGYAAKGVVYGLVGALALQLAFGRGGETTGARGILREIAEGPGGGLLLGIIALGLVGYSLWRLASAITDAEGAGNDLAGLGKRASYAGSGLIHLALAWSAVQLAAGAGAGGDLPPTAPLLAHGWGRVLLGIVALVTIGVGLFQFRKAYRETFARHWRVGEIPAGQRRWAVRAGRWGLAARGVVFALVGFFLMRAAWQADPGEARDAGGTLAELARAGPEPWLLVVVAAGLVAYGVYCFVEARYRHFRVRPPAGAERSQRPA
jgi:hypothetical protein